MSLFGRILSSPYPDICTLGTINVMSPSPSNEQFIQRNLRYNFTVNMLDGGFFGFALGLTKASNRISETTVCKLLA